MNEALYMLMYDTWNAPDCDAMWDVKPTIQQQALAAYWLAAVGA